MRELHNGLLILPKRSNIEKVKNLVAKICYTH